MHLLNMFSRKLGLRTKMFILFGGLCSAVVIALTTARLFGMPLFGDDGALKRINLRAEQRIELVADYKQQMLEQWLVGCQLEIQRLSRYKPEFAILQQMTSTDDVNRMDALQQLTKRLDYFSNFSTSMDSTSFIAVPSGQIVASSKLFTTDITVSEKLLARALAHPALVTVGSYHNSDHSNCGVVFAQPVLSPISAQPLGIFIATSGMNNFIRDILHNIEGLGATAEVVLVDQHNNLLFHLKHQFNDLRTSQDMAARTEGCPSLLATKDKDGLTVGIDYRGQPIVAAHRYIRIDDDHSWGMVVKQDRQETMQLLIGRINGSVTTGVIGIVLVLLGVFFIARYLYRPFAMLSRAAEQVRSGNLSARAPVGGSIEEDKLAEVFNSMVEYIADWHLKLESEVIQKTDKLTQAYETLQKSEQQRLAIAEVNNVYLHNGEVRSALELLIKQALCFTGATTGRFWRCETNIAGETHAISLTDTIQLDNDRALVACQMLPLLEDNHELLAEIIGNKRSLILDEKLVLNEQQLLLQGLPSKDQLCAIKSLLLVPVIQGDKIYGLISLANKEDGFVVEDEEWVAAFAATAALIMNADRRERQRVAAEEVARVKGAFLATMSHELRTPMNVVIGMSALLLDTELNAIQQDYLQKISASSRQLLAIINDVLDVSKLESGHQLTINLSPFEPEQVFHSVVSLHAYNLDEQQVELHVDISREVPHQLKGDAQRLEQVLGNLLSNAVKFTPSGDILLAVRVLKRNEDEVTLEFSVSDSGIGIGAHQQEQMFQPFVQADGSNTRQQGGTGLGLTISRQLCQLMGGELTLESIAGAGSLFRFQLPFEVLAEEDKVRSLIPANKLLDLRVLAVDDNSIGRRILKNILTRMKFDVEVVNSAKKALTAIRIAEDEGQPFGLLIVDDNMPEISGMEMSKMLAEQQTSEAPRILMVTANQKELLMQQAQDAGIDAVVAKPVQPSPLFDAIMQVFGYTSITPSSSTSTCSVLWDDVQLLLVEDHELNRQVARDLLTKVGISAAEAINGAVAVEMVRNHKYDIVLMDIQMPVMDGLEATNIIRKLDNCSIEQLPIVAMTANAFEQDRQDSLNAGMNGHLNKPIDPAKLYAELEHWLPPGKLINIANEQQDGVTLPHPSLLQALATLPRMNIALGLSYADGNQQRYYQLLQKFADSFAPTASMLRYELNNEQQSQATIRVHSLKALAGTLGATELHQAATKLEEQLRNNQQPQALNEMLELLEPLLAACAELPQLYTSTEKNDADLPAATAQQLQQILIMMIPALEKLKAKECEELAVKLKQKRWPMEFSADLLQLQQLIDRYRFTQALELVKTMHSKLHKGNTHAGS